MGKKKTSKGKPRKGLIATLLIINAGLALYLIQPVEEVDAPNHTASSPNTPLNEYQPTQTAEPAQSNFVTMAANTLQEVRKTISNYGGTQFKQEASDYPFYIAEKEWNRKEKKYDFYRKGMKGSEVALKVDARRSFLSESQADYPEPESGCGPTALLNLYIWYTKFGLLKESIRYANVEKYKRLKFDQIDDKLLQIQKESRTDRGGTNTLAAIVAMDELVQEHAVRPTRLHFEIKQPPLRSMDFMDISRNYRAGLLSVKPKDKKTGELLDNHVVLCIRGDKSGVITIANWGEFSHGRLIQRSDGQWFVPRDPSEHELKINRLTKLVPFHPER